MTYVFVFSYPSFNFFLSVLDVQYQRRVYLIFSLVPFLIYILLYNMLIHKYWICISSVRFVE